MEKVVGIHQIMNIPSFNEEWIHSPSTIDENLWRSVRSVKCMIADYGAQRIKIVDIFINHHTMTVLQLIPQ